MKLPVSVELAAATPLTGLSLFASWMTAYSSVIITSLAILAFGAQMTWRFIEHRAIMRKNSEVSHGEERRK
ncbi:holin class II [Xanthomonas phage Xaa_vB_phi31]|uniref:Holin class II n=1 Tax=Xanthomonas phage Xaa_vB_phi31 TaxID=2776752 RepID=A0A868BZ34_9CAUD|nr:holin class II [Xanthomonas phage Xaa_vB_phi31]